MIIPGSATIQGQNVVIQPPQSGSQTPGAFGGLLAVRLTNYTPDVIILSNITGDAPGEQQYLMPFQQMVFKTDNIRNSPTATAQSLGTNFDTSALLVEWSTDPTTDFPGTYPIALTEAPLAGVGSGTSGGTVVLAANAHSSIPADDRASTTIINYGPGNVYFSGTDNPPTNPPDPWIPVGASITYQNGSQMFLLADSSGATVGWFGETF